MKLGSFLSLVLIAGFLFVAINRMHPVGYPNGNPDIFKDRSDQITDISNVSTMDDYFLRNGQRETGSNNIVSSVVFDYRGFDTLGEATVLFLVVSSISMLLFNLIKKDSLKIKMTKEKIDLRENVSRIIFIGAVMVYPLIIVFGAYLVIHGHISPGGGFQGGAVMASGTALLIISAHFTGTMHTMKKIFSFIESLGLTVFISIGFAGLSTGFLVNFLANGTGLLGKTIPLGPNPGYLNSGGTLPLLSLAIGIEVFFGLSIILISLYQLVKRDEIDENRKRELM